MNLTPQSFAQLVDHTILKAEANDDDIDRVCAEAIAMQTKSVCVNSMWVPRVTRALFDRGVITCSVVGFPLGAMNIPGLVAETKGAVEAGAREIDMVVPLGLWNSGAKTQVKEHIEAVREASDGAVLKVILETACLSLEDVAELSHMCVDVQADFVKTSTGFHPAGGATVEAVRVMRETVGDKLGVKASGGIRTLSEVTEMIEAGASRLGMSSTGAVFHELSQEDD